MGKLGWTLILLVWLAALLFGLWHWALNAQSVSTLDRADAIFTSNSAKVSQPILFGPEADQKLVVVTPSKPAERPLPVVIFIHGGSWAKGDPVDYAYIGRNFAPEGYVVVSAGYRLVPGGEFPAMLEDGAASVRWVVDNIAHYGGNPDRIYLMGHSAGAYNAVMLALDPQWLEQEGLPGNTIDGAIGLAGPYDFLPLDSESTKNAFGAASNLDRTQPINFVGPNTPPILLLTGNADETVRPRNSRALAAKISKSGAQNEPVEFDNMGHAGIIMALSRPFAGDGAVKRAIIEWLAKQEATQDLENGTPSGTIQPAQG
ncbi:alpha/beta hydrolase fold domain-containing protein [Erythrobacter jejuensis]|uniref:Alpha/beta hydrolase fold domain-containing protein n=1 Tax=Parerythrobacter jejuensis TaxID=795812 RepID=A0A845AWW1_9SPHN|nr:alpha/beta hydrolase fold domain-containing protein [Parerythrobacter jejuensis]MXP33777.1 alpha/beta hydrolase fold domain-containing protein [Parerythrobacter jejuensis]